MPEHGTYNGAQAHYRKGETPCEPCRLAKNAHQREPNRVEKARIAAKMRRKKKATHAAVKRLVDKYFEEYKVLYAEEYEKLGR